jgi:hypothetical protein
MVQCWGILIDGEPVGGASGVRTKKPAEAGLYCNAAMTRISGEIPAKIQVDYGVKKTQVRDLRKGPP